MSRAGAPGPAGNGVADARPLDRGAVAVLVGGVLCVSTAAPLIRMAEAPPLTIAAWRMTFAALLLWAMVPFAGGIDRTSLRRGDMARMLVAGAFLAAHFALWITSLAYTSVASSVVLVTTNPLWVGLAAPLVLHEPVPRRLFAGIALAFVGGIVIAWGDLGLGGDAIWGDLLAIGGAWAAAAYFLIGRRVRAHVCLLPYVAIVYGTAAVVLFAVALVTGTSLAPLSPATWTVLVALAIVPQILGHSSFNWALSRLSATFVAGTVLGEAVGSTILAWIVLGEAPPTPTVVGGAAILGGLIVAAKAEQQSAPWTGE